MKQIFLTCFVVLFCFTICLFGQIPTNTLVQIVKAEDERRFDKTLENLLTSSNERVRTRAALAIGRIGDENGIPSLTKLLQTDSSNEVRAMALFALGETESPKATPVIIEALKNQESLDEIRARAFEAAGKIVAANPKDDMSKQLGEAILQALDIEGKKGMAANRKVVLHGLTAVLRARPTNAEKVIVGFLDYPDARVRADTLNTLARLRSKNANEKSRELLQKDTDAVVRANAARVLGAAEDKSALDLLLKAAVGDADLRVRVSAIRSLANLKDAGVADALLSRAEKLLQDYASFKTSVVYPKEKNELLEIVTTLGRLLQNSNNELAVKILTKYSKSEHHLSPEIEIALARISPAGYAEGFSTLAALAKNGGDPIPLVEQLSFNWQAISSVSQGLAEVANPDKNRNEKTVSYARSELRIFLATLSNPKLFEHLSENPKAFPGDVSKSLNYAIPDVLRAFAAFKTDDLPEVLREHLKHNDAVVRATAAELLANSPSSKENLEALKTAFDKSLLTDNVLNDAQLAILDALFKLDKKEAIPTLVIAMNSKDYLVRKKAFELLRDKDLRDSDLVKITLEKALAQKKNQILPYSFGSKLGVILNTNADYLRAVTRKSAKAIITTGKGAFTIDFYPEAAPLTVDNFIRLARSGYFNNVMIHRVVPNFVMQDGDPRGDGNGGPGWEIRCEINMIPYERGAVGMALSGKDTGGSQWFVTHSPQPHLDGGYTVFGRVNEADMKIVDNLVRSDKILSVKIVEGNSPPKPTRRKSAR